MNSSSLVQSKFDLAGSKQRKLMRKSSSNSLSNGIANNKRAEVQEMLNQASDQGFGLGGKII